MAQLWGGRFTKETDKLVYNFNASISFDQKFYAQDIRGSIAHVTMLQKQGILTKEEKESIIEGLKGIQADVENGTLEITDEYEDIHSFVEANLIDRIGDAGKKLHTGRSRNDQGGAGYAAVHKRRDRSTGYTFKRIAGSAFKTDERAYRDVYAGIYTSSESTAGDTCASSWRIF